MSFPFFQQYDTMDCGPTCLRMVAKHYGKNYSLQTLRMRADASREGVSLLSLSEAAQSIGLHAFGAQVTFEQLCEEAPLPCIVYWNQNHFVVVHKITQRRRLFGRGGAITVAIADPAKGLCELSEADFMRSWTQGLDNGIALIIEPTPTFFVEEDDPAAKLNFNRVFQYVKQYKKYLFQLLIGLFIGGILQLIFPLLTQAIVDTGIVTNDLNFIYLVLIAQVMIFLGQTVVEFVRSWLLMFISTRINLSILSDFFSKLMKLPVAFFDVKAYGDIMQRIGDHYRIDNFLTGNSVNFLFSVFTLLVFGGLMAFYNEAAFLVFLAGSVLYVSWILLFMNYRKKLDYKRFDLAAKGQSNVVQILRGMQEIKLAGAETVKRWEWERLQVRQFKLNMHNLKVNQYQQIGALVFNHGKNILITFLSARAVIANELTLGEMMALQYILGQLNGPVEQLIQFIQAYQDARLSLARLNEVHELAEEEPADALRATFLPPGKDLRLQDVSFKYPGGLGNVLHDISFDVRRGKVTAIVGMSGSGKTTLLKLLLKFYDPTTGKIRLGDAPLEHVSHSVWRRTCGTVMQEGYIFSDTITNNIAFGEERIDYDRLMEAIRIANIEELLGNLPLGLHTKIGDEGVGLSQGQRQRILIARAVYKNPDFIFFDEATSALDATNESIIVRNLEDFFATRTVLIVAHRLSTVRKADHIVVLENGRVVEEGNHASLLLQEGKYYELVKDQLELAV